MKKNAKVDTLNRHIHCIFWMILFVILLLLLNSCSDKKKTTDPTPQTATVIITLVPNDGGSVVGANVVLRHHSGYSHQQTATSENVILINVPYGTYSVIVSMAGYYAYTYESLSVQNHTVGHSTLLTSTTVQIGQIIQFGTHQWRVLDIQEGRAKIISVNVLELRAYHTSYVDINWSQCSLRTYLNGTFLNSDVFTAADRIRITQVTIQNPNNPYGIPGGPATLDRIFLLSIAEAQQYFDNDSDRIAYLYGSAFGWWLRSPGYSRYGAAYVFDGGYISVGGFNVNNPIGGVRPALWLNLSASR